MTTLLVLCEGCVQPMPVSNAPRCPRCGTARPDLRFAPRHATPADAVRAAQEAVREPALRAAAALRAGKEDPGTLGECRKTFLTGRPKYWHRYEWANAPGFVKVVEGSTRSRKPPVTTFEHRLLPGWVYAHHELWELLQDLDNLAAGRGWPTAPTTNAPGAEPPRQGQLL